MVESLGSTSPSSPVLADQSKVAALFAEALAHFQAGRFLDTQICCRQALEHDPGHADTLHLLGLVSLQAKQYDAAIEWISRAIRQDPKPEYLASLATSLRHQGRYEDAFNTMEKAVQLKPDDADLWAGLGKALVDQKRPAEALLTFQHALKLDPQHWDSACQSGILFYKSERLAEALAAFGLCDAIRPDHFSTTYMRAVILHKQGKSEPALAESRRAHALDPANADASSLVGNVLHAAGRREEALPWLDRALELRPDFEALFNKAVLLRELGQLEDSLAHLDRCNELQPNSVPTLIARATVLLGLRRFEPALTDYQRAHELDPANADTCNNMGTVLSALDRDEDALPWYDRALRLRPGFATALLNKAVSLGDSRRVEEALSTFALVKGSDQQIANADWNRSLLQLRTGNFEAGWLGRESRWRIPTLSAGYPELSEPLWLGEEAIEGKTVLVWADEGLGDTIQFARYVPMLAERGARVILCVPKSIVALLSGLSGVAQCISSSAPPRPAFDVHCPIGSLPLAFRTELESIPVKIPYLPLPASDRVKVWQDRLGAHDRLRVGLVWSGNPEHKNDHNRSSSLRAFSAMFDVDAAFFSLQKDPRPDDKAVLGQQHDLVDLTAQLTDFAETAALITCLDVVITVDTSVAHLAGALGRPTWVLLPYTPDWRWMLDREDSPWYPSMRLFRQSASRDYGEVIDRMRDELRREISKSFARS